VDSAPQPLLSSSVRPALASSLAQAERLEKKCEWRQAADLYRQILGESSPDMSLNDTARITSQLAESYFRAAFQAKDHVEFLRIIALSRDSYNTAADDYEEVGVHGESNRMTARKLFAEYWLVSQETTQMMQLLQECVKVAAETVRLAENEQDSEHLAYAHKDQLAYICELLFFMEEWALANEHFHTALASGEAAVKSFEESGRDQDLVEALHLTILLLSVHGAGVILPVEEVKRLKPQATALAEKLSDASNRLGSEYAKSLRDEALGLIAYFFEGDPAKALKLFENGFEAVTDTRDSLLLGRFYNGAVVMAAWIETPEDSEQKRSLLNKSLKEFIPVAIRNMRVSNHPQWLNWTYGWWAECHFCLAREVETEPEKKTLELRKAIEIARKGMEYERDSGWTAASHALSKSLFLLARLSSDVAEKKVLLSEALPIREDQARKADAQFPHSFDKAVMYFYLGDAKVELAATEQDVESRKAILQSAATVMAECVEVAVNWPTPERLVAIARFEETYGDILLQLDRLGAETNQSREAIKIYSDAVSHLKKGDFPGPAAPLLWKVANVHDSLGDYRQASETFRTAAQTYEEVSRKAPGATDTLADLASYMQAWAWIEDARLNHSEDEFSLASENYLKAAETMQASRHWNYLASHYRACALLERAEALSWQEQHEESLKSFKSAERIFQETRRDLEKRLADGTAREDRAELDSWIQITISREKYSCGRSDLEEAVILDRKGQEAASSKEYLSASEIFRELSANSVSDQAKREFETLTQICKAWSKMKDAEANASPELYAEASKLFNEAQAVATRKRSRLLAFANASMCRALEAGTRFRETRDTRLYADIKKSLETATDYYGQAGDDNAEEWTRATKRLFDALAYLSEAESEIESKRKAELYHLAVKQLDNAALLYDKAGYPSKKEEALRHLRRAKEEKELLLTPIEALADSPALGTGAVVPASLLRDKAVGLERFETAQVVGNIGLRERECRVGTDLTLELELANVGRTPATLVKLENIAPDGLEINREAGPNRLEDNYLDFRGRRLEYMKSHEVKLSLRAKQKGTFQISPRILFVDEGGNYRSYEFEPATINVKEHGIFGLSEGGRRLAAIMFTDIVGYTALSQRDEKQALKVLERHNNLLRPIFAKHGGIEIKTIGDSFLAEFTSALAATECAIEIQQMLAEVNKDTESSSFMVRIGLHLGDVIGRGNDIFGDAVNIASRIQPLAEPGGICLSEGVYSVIRNKISYPIEMVPAVTLKNVELPMNVYTIARFSNTERRETREPTAQKPLPKS